jgi:carboxylesterase type B
MTTTTTIHEVPGRGFQKCAAFLDPNTGQVLCYRAGGIRYARPLDPSERWRRARPLKPASVQYGSREHPTDCTGVAAECPQPGGRAKLLVREDCLQLNIWIPAEAAPADGWPVFFYIRMLPFR